jgi:hypothetical protein
MAYLLFIPVAYYGTSHVANKIFNMTSDYVLECEELHDDSSALLTAVMSVLEKFKDMKDSHPAFKSKVLVEEGVDSLLYMSKTTKERWYQRNYHQENSKLKRLQDELERRLRLFLLVVRG